MNRGRAVVMVNGCPFEWTPERGLDLGAVLQLEGFLRREARQAAARFAWMGLNEEDFIQEARLAAMEAARCYDPDRGASFLHWVSFGLRSAFARCARPLVGGLGKGPRVKVFSLDAPMDGQEEDGACMAEDLADAAPGPLDESESGERWRLLDETLERLPLAERRVVSLHLGAEGGKGLEIRAVAHSLGMPEARVRALLRQGMDRLRSLLERRLAATA